MDGANASVDLRRGARYMATLSGLGAGYIWSRMFLVLMSDISALAVTHSAWRILVNSGVDFNF